MKGKSQGKDKKERKVREGGNEEGKVFIWADFFQYHHNDDSFLFSLVKYNAALHKKEITNQPNLQIHCHIKNVNKNFFTFQTK